MCTCQTVSSLQGLCVEVQVGLSLVMFVATCRATASSLCRCAMPSIDASGMSASLRELFKIEHSHGGRASEIMANADSILHQHCTVHWTEQSLMSD
jgi:hypothetical protein